MSVNNKFIGVILAGGRGTRMFPLSNHYPKPLLPVGNRPLLVHQLDLIKNLGIEEVVILIGHRGYEIPLAIGDGSQFGLKIRYVEQTEVLGIAHAVGRLEPYIDRPFLLFLGDIYFVPDDLQQMLTAFHAQEEGAILAVKEEPNPSEIRKNFAVIQDEAGLVIRVIEKPRSLPNRLKGVGLYLFDLSVFDAIRRTPRTAMRDEYEITDTIQVMIDFGASVRAVKCIQSDINVTTPADLLHCNLLELSAVPNQVVIGEGGHIHPEARLERCVLGENVHIEHPIQLRDSLIFSDTYVEADTNFDQFILLPDAILDCGYKRAGVRRAPK